VTGSHKHSNEPEGFIKGEEFLDFSRILHHGVSQLTILAIKIQISSRI
jgi:hypothetical protein